MQTRNPLMRKVEVPAICIDMTFMEMGNVCWPPSLSTAHRLATRIYGVAQFDNEYLVFSNGMKLRAKFPCMLKDTTECLSTKADSDLLRDKFYSIGKHNILYTHNQLPLTNEA